MRSAFLKTGASVWACEDGHDCKRWKTAPTQADTLKRRALFPSLSFVIFSLVFLLSLVPVHPLALAPLFCLFEPILGRLLWLSGCRYFLAVDQKIVSRCGLPLSGDPVGL